MNLLIVLTSVLFSADIPLPTVEQRMMLHKQHNIHNHLMLPGDYWDEGHNFDVLNYDIDMTVDIPADSVWADVTITMEVRELPLDTVPLNFHWPFTIESIKEDGRDLDWTSVVAYQFKVALDREVAVGETLSVTVSYHGKPAEQDGLFIAEIDNDSAVTFVDSEPQGARHWIPCYDEPSDKATFTQRITVPADYDLVANGTLESLEKNGQWWTYTWQEHYPQPTYLIVFAASKHFVTKDMTAIVDGQEVPMRVWMLEANDTREKFNDSPEMVEYFSEIFPPYPFADEKYDQVHAPLGGAMENTTCTFFNTFYNWGGGYWNWVIAHELSHDWWGDWLTCATWADLWLNEGFATYCEALWMEHEYGEEGYRQYAAGTMDFYLEYGMLHSIYDPPLYDLFGIVTYDKAGSVVYMLREVLGDSLFFAVLNEYGWRHANQSVITDDFHEIIEEISGKDIDWFFDQWIYGPGHPHYEYAWAPVTPVSVTPAPLRGIPTIKSFVNNEITPAPLRGISPIKSTNDEITHQSSTPAYQIEFAIAQTQDQSLHYFPYRMPMEIGAYYGEDVQVISFIDSVGYQRFSVELDQQPDSVILDPSRKILCEKTQLDNIEDVPDPGVVETSPVLTATLIVDNIVTDVLRIRFSQPGNNQVNISLYDASGRQVRNFYSGQTREFYRVYPVSDLVSGVYFIRVSNSKGEVMSAKTVKLR